MIIGLDYDETYTRDPLMWNWFCEQAIERGHTVWCVSARSPRHMDEVRQTLGLVIGAERCVGSDGAAKSPFMWQTHDVMVDVWIDDCPAGVETDFSAYSQHQAAE